MNNITASEAFFFPSKNVAFDVQLAGFLFGCFRLSRVANVSN